MQEYITLANNEKIPKIFLGTYQINRFDMVTTLKKAYSVRLSSF